MLGDSSQTHNITGRGIPIYTASIPNLSNKNIVVTDVNRDLNKYTLSEALKQANWKSQIPKLDKVKDLIDQQVYNPNFKTDLFYNIRISTFCLLFLISAVSLDVRAAIFALTKRLSKIEEDSETVRVFTDALGYFWAPFLISTDTSLTNIYKLINGYLASKQKSKELCVKYSKMRADIVHKHTITEVFFELAEIIESLKKIYFSNAQDLLIYESIREHVEKIKDNTRLDFELFQPSGIAPDDEHSLRGVIQDFKRKLFSSDFNPITDKIKEFMKRNAAKLENRSVLQPKTLRIDSTYSKRIDNDETLQDIIIDIIGEIASIRVRPNPSELTLTITMLKESTLDEIKDTLVIYWNSPKMKKNLKDPYDADIKHLAMLINTQIRYRYPHLFLDSGLTMPLLRQPVLHSRPTPASQQEAIPTTLQGFTPPAAQHQMWNGCF